jgi:hypothetical protein
VTHGALIAVGAGLLGILTRLLLLTFYGLLAAGSDLQRVLGSASTVTGAVEVPLIALVLVALPSYWPPVRKMLVLQPASLVALGVASAIGLMAVGGLLPASVATPVTVAALLVLAVWLVRVNGTMRRTVTWPLWMLVGEICGMAMLVGATIDVLGWAMPSLSTPQMTLFLVGGLPAFLGYLVLPVWFLALGLHLRSRELGRR